MQEERLLSLLGLARKANKCAFGHDAAKAALRGGKARLCLLCADASPRLKEEFITLAGETHVPCLQTALTQETLKHATQYKAAVLTLNERGFAEKIKTLLEPETKPES